MPLAPLLLAAALAQPPIPVYAGPGFERTRLAEGVWAFVFDNPLGPAVDGTALVIVNDEDVVVVDAQNTPGTTRRVLAEIRRLTPKPVRYVVNTHWHGDHHDGNEVYRRAFPGVEFVAHAHTRADMITEVVPIMRGNDTTLARELAGMERRYAAGTRRDGNPLSASDSALVREYIALYRWIIPEMRDTRVVLPTLTVADSLVLHRTVGGAARTIAIRHLGRGNTRGDVVVHLPRERIVATGDLLVNPVPYAFGSYLAEWTRTLGAVRALGADVLVPGHGTIQRDAAYLDLVVRLLEETAAQARAAVARGLDLEATRKAVALDSLRARFTGGDPARERAFEAYFAQPAVERAWREARGELDRSRR